METETYKYLRFVQFEDVENWSVQFLIGRQFNYTLKYPFVSISEILTRNRTAVQIENEKEYKRVTIKQYNGGICLRDIEKGTNIGTKNQFRINKGQFLLSKIDARNGAFGVVPEEVDNAIVTNDFPSFEIDCNSVCPSFLSLIATTTSFVEFAKSCSSGTTNRRRINIDDFLSQKIPLPTLSEQEAIVSAYNTKIAKAAALESQATETEAEIERYLLEELGVRISQSKNKNLLNFISFQETSRWDLQFLLSKISVKSNYDTTTIGDCISNFLADEQQKSLRIETHRTPKKLFEYIGMEHIEKETGTLLDMPIVKGEEIKSQTIRVPHKYFIYGKLRPYLNKYWQNTTNKKEIVCSSEFFVFIVKTSINQDFFKFVLASTIVQKQIADATSGARMPRINETTFKNIPIPLPPLSVQNAIVEHINTLKEQIKHCKAQASALRTQALADFEKEIFA